MKGDVRGEYGRRRSALTDVYAPTSIPPHLPVGSHERIEGEFISLRSSFRQIVLALAALTAATALFAQGTPPKRLSQQQFTYNSKHEFTGLTVRVGTLALSVQSDVQNAHLKAEGMPALVKQQDVDGRDVGIVTETGTPIVEIGLNDSAHPEKLTLGNDVKFMVVARGDGRYKQTLLGPRGKVFGDRLVNPLPRRPGDVVFLEPVAADLGLSSDWRSEITVETEDSLQIIKNKATGKTLLYIVRSGPDRVAFLPDGTPFYYDVIAQLYFGRAKHTESYADLQSVVPDRFIYTRDGRIGAYVTTPANNGIASFWMERDSSGNTLVHFNAGASTTKSPHAASSLGVSPDGPAQIDGDRELAAPRRYLRPSPNATYYCESSQTCVTTQTGEESCFEPRTTCYCVDCMEGGVGTCSEGPSIMSIADPRPECGGGGTSSSGSSSNQIVGNARLSQDVSNGLTNATNKLNTKSQCAALVSNLTTTSPQAGGTPLVTIMNQRGYSNPATYINGPGMAFFYGQTKTDTNGYVPCSSSTRYAWTTPGSTAVQVCDKYTSLEGQTGMEGNILIHEMLHTLGLPEGGQGQYTNQQITNLVTSACGN
ncbi:MAG TPA: hypothetical protein VJZ76_16965 [Thermoanaerobaculia bacterium]|nr:hypothetical protein [Thermoanaerobaculia bacterium]